MHSMCISKGFEAIKKYRLNTYTHTNTNELDALSLHLVSYFDHLCNSAIIGFHTYILELYKQ